MLAIARALAGTSRSCFWTNPTRACPGDRARDREDPRMIREQGITTIIVEQNASRLETCRSGRDPRHRARWFSTAPPRTCSRTRELRARISGHLSQGPGPRGRHATSPARQAPGHIEDRLQGTTNDTRNLSAEPRDRRPPMPTRPGTRRCTPHRSRTRRPSGANRKASGSTGSSLHQGQEHQLRPGNVSIKWFEDGTLNVAANCIDRHLAHARRPDRDHLGAGRSRRRGAKHITYAELHATVCGWPTCSRTWAWARATAWCSTCR